MKHVHLLLFALMVSCTGSSDPSGPGTILGAWSGDGARVDGTTSSAQLGYPCQRVDVSTALTFGADGRFVVGGGRQRVGGAPPITPEPIVPVTLEGLVTGRAPDRSLRLIVRPATDLTAADTFHLREGRAASVLACP